MLLLVLLADDAALLHESVLPALGISEHAVYAAYGLIVSAWIAVFRKEIFASEFALLALAAAAPASRSPWHSTSSAAASLSRTMPNTSA